MTGGTHGPKGTTVHITSQQRVPRSEKSPARKDECEKTHSVPSIRAHTTQKINTTVFMRMGCAGRRETTSVPVVGRGVHLEVDLGGVAEYCERLLVVGFGGFLRREQGRAGQNRGNMNGCSTIGDEPG